MKLLVVIKRLGIGLCKAAARSQDPRRPNRWTRFVLTVCAFGQISSLFLVNAAVAADTDISFSISAAVSDEDASYVMEGIALAQDYVDETLSEFSEPLVINVRGTDDTTGGDAVAFYGGNYIAVFTGSPGWSSMLPFDRVHVVVHEFVHAYQHDRLQGAESALPAWFIEGMAEYLSYDAVADLGLVRPGAVRDYHAWAVASAPELADLKALHGQDAFYSEHGPVYSLAYLAIADLMADRPVSSLVRFFNRIRLGQEWRAAFKLEFDRDIDAFYAAFSEALRDLVSPVRIPEPFTRAFPRDLDAGVFIDSDVENIAAGQQLLLLGRSGAGAICQFSLTGAQAGPDLSGSSFADGSGRVFWLITIPLPTAIGPAELSTDCGGEPVTVEIEITDGW